MEAEITGASRAVPATTAGSRLDLATLQRWHDYCAGLGEYDEYRMRALETYLEPVIPDLLNPEISEIFVNTYCDVRRRRRGIDEVSNATFGSEERLVDVISTIAGQNGVSVGSDVEKGQVPILDARLPDGSRVAATVAPVCLAGATLIIRKHSKTLHTGEALVKLNTITWEALEWLQAHIERNCNTLVSGGTASGKTTMLNVLLRYLDPTHRIITVEDPPELQLHGEQVLPLRIAPELGIEWMTLLKFCMRCSPHHIIFGEIRPGKGSPAYAFIQAINSGHEGSMATEHANGREESMIKYRDMCFDGAGPNVPEHVISRAIGGAFQIVLQLMRIPTSQGMRTIVESICLCRGYNDTHREFILEPVFEFPRNQATGRLMPDGTLKRTSDAMWGYR